MSSDHAAASLLASFPSASAPRLRRLLARWTPSEALHRISENSAEAKKRFAGSADPSLPVEWVAKAKQALDLIPSQQIQMQKKQISAWWLGEPLWDDVFLDDPDPPAVLFYRGDLGLLKRSAVGLIGTRSASTAGLQMARKLAAEVSRAGAAVVSGLALGIDGAAHRAAIEANGYPIGVVASGIDVVYPTRNADLWKQVGERGLLLTESPPGRRPMTYTFPERNRIIAQLSKVLVVVESSKKGGSLITVDRALERGRPVMAVPGTPLLESTGGSNELLRGGRLGRLALPCLGGDDVLSVLDLAEVCSDTYLDQRAEPSETGAAILSAMGWDSWTVGNIVVRTGLTIGQVTAGLNHLESDSWVSFGSGRWHRVAATPGEPQPKAPGQLRLGEG